MGKNERRGWTLVAILLLIGLLCVTAAGNLAIRFAPRWTLQADMRSRLDPNSAYFTSLPENFFLPVDPAILTPPIWINLFLTPGQSIPTRVPQATGTPQNTSVPRQISSTIAPTTTPTPTGTFVLFTPTRFFTPKPTATKTATAIYIGTLPPSRTNTATGSATSTATPTPTNIPSSTPTSTATSIAAFTETSTPTDTPTLIYTDPLPGEIGPSPDSIVYNLLAGGSLTLEFPIDVKGHNGYDLVYYELPMGSGIWLDWVTVEISDGRNWYTIFDWGDNIADSNTNMDFNYLPYPVMEPIPPPEEPDQRDVPSASLYPYPGTGIAIDLDSVVPPGSYYYIRFSCPSSINGVPDTDGKMEIDAIAVLP
jgi:hypothetical protein